MAEPTRKVHLQYTDSGYPDRGICAPWDHRSKTVTTDPNKLTCRICKRFIYTRVRYRRDFSKKPSSEIDRSGHPKWFGGTINKWIWIGAKLVDGGEDPHDQEEMSAQATSDWIVRWLDESNRLRVLAEEEALAEEEGST